MKIKEMAFTLKLIDCGKVLLTGNVLRNSPEQVVRFYCCFLSVDIYKCILSNLKCTFSSNLRSRNESTSYTKSSRDCRRSRERLLRPALECTTARWALNSSLWTQCTNTPGFRYCFNLSKFSDLPLCGKPNNEAAV